MESVTIHHNSPLHQHGSENVIHLSSSLFKEDDFKATDPKDYIDEHLKLAFGNVNAKFRYPSCATKGVHVTGNLLSGLVAHFQLRCLVGVHEGQVLYDNVKYLLELGAEENEADSMTIFQRVMELYRDSIVNRDFLERTFGSEKKIKQHLNTVVNTFNLLLEHGANRNQTCFFDKTTTLAQLFTQGKKALPKKYADILKNLSSHHTIQ